MEIRKADLGSNPALSVGAAALKQVGFEHA